MSKDHDATSERVSLWGGRFAGGPSEALASARPDLITFEPWSLARHCKEWNVDPRRWESVVTEFVR